MRATEKNSRKFNRHLSMVIGFVCILLASIALLGQVSSCWLSPKKGVEHEEASEHEDRPVASDPVGENEEEVVGDRRDIETEPEQKPHQVQCRLPQAVDLPYSPTLVWDKSEFSIKSKAKIIEPSVDNDGTIELVVSSVPGHVRFVVPNLMRGTLLWDWDRGGRVTCVATTGDSQLTGIYGRLQGDVRPGTYVHGCGGVTEVEPDGSYYLEALPDPCYIQAILLNDEQISSSEGQYVQPRQGTDIEVNIKAPPSDQVSSFAEHDQRLSKTIEVLAASCGRGTEDSEACRDRLVAPLEEERAMIIMLRGEDRPPQ